MCVWLCDCVCVGGIRKYDNRKLVLNNKRFFSLLMMFALAMVW